MEADLLGPRCEDCGSALYFFTQDGRAVQDCDVCGLSYVPLRHPTPVALVLPVGGIAPWARDATRDAVMVIMSADGRSRKEIGAHFGISPDRVTQILTQIQRDKAVDDGAADDAPVEASADAA